MSEPLLKHETFEYRADEPFLVINIVPARVQLDRLLNHWHEELEIAYVLKGTSLHYIDGVCYHANPGRLLVTNTESVHNIVPDPATDGLEEIATILLLVHAQYLESLYPDFRSVYFLNDQLQARPEVAEIMLQLSKYGQRTERKPYDSLYARGLILQLLYYLFEGGYTEKETALNINIQKNVERLKGILQYVENHYQEPITQGEIAKKFYFNRDYFSRYFKASTGISFTKYLLGYRLQKAQADLLSSDSTILQIALRNGFTDDRRLITAFKAQYGITPLQFRKKCQKQRENVLIL